MPAFKYDGAVLDPEQVEITIAEKKVIFTELPKRHFDAMLKDLFTVELQEEREVPIENTDDEGNKTVTQEKRWFRREMDAVKGELEPKAIKYLALSTGETEEFFTKYLEDAPASTMTKLLQIVYEINHVAEVLTAGGNVTMLPVMMELLKKPASETTSSE